VCVSAFGDCAEPFVGELEDIREVVCVAVQHIDKWLDGMTKEDQVHSDVVYDALDILTLIEATLGAGLNPTNGKTVLSDKWRAQNGI
jgi:hypothetical protein